MGTGAWTSELRLSYSTSEYCETKGDSMESHRRTPLSPDLISKGTLDDENGQEGGSGLGSQVNWEQQGGGAFKGIPPTQERIGPWKGIEGTGCSSMLESIIFSLFYVDKKFDNFIGGGGTTCAYQFMKEILGKMVKSMRYFPYCCPNLYTRHLIHILDLQRYSAKSEDAELLISRIFRALGHEKENFITFNDNTSTFIQEIILYNNSDLRAIILDDLVHNEMISTSSSCHSQIEKIKAPIFIVYIDRNFIRNCRVQLFPSFQIQTFGNNCSGNTNEPWRLAGIICAPDFNKISCYNAFIRFENAGTIIWQWYLSKTSAPTEQTMLPEVRKLDNLEQELIDYANTGSNQNLSTEMKYIFQFGVLYLYYNPKDPRITGDIPAQPVSYPLKERDDISRHSMETCQNFESNYEKSIHAKALQHDRIVPEQLDESSATQSELSINERNTVNDISPEMVQLCNSQSCSVNKTSTKISKMDVSLDKARKEPTESERDGFFSHNCLKTGRKVGIEQKDNSCYIDSTLFSLFYSSKLFDSLLVGRPQIEAPTTSSQMITKLSQKNARKFLTTIVESLREEHFVPYKQIELFREELHKLHPNLSTTRMADVDDFIRILMGKALDVPKFLTYTGGTSNYLHQIMFNSKTGKSSEKAFKNLDALFYESMDFQELKLLSVPSPALIIKMSRSNGKLIRDRGILPNLTIDISRAVQNGDEMDGVLHLHSVIVLNSCHYTAFVRCGLEMESPWLYFDSIGPKVTAYPSLGKDLNDCAERVKGGLVGVPTMPSLKTVARLAMDNHVCLYVPKRSSRGAAASTTGYDYSYTEGSLV